MQEMMTYWYNSTIIVLFYAKNIAETITYHLTMKINLLNIQMIWRIKYIFI